MYITTSNLSPRRVKTLDPMSHLGPWRSPLSKTYMMDFPSMFFGCLRWSRKMRSINKRHFLYIFLEHSTTISKRYLSLFAAIPSFLYSARFYGFLYIGFCILLCFHAFCVVQDFCILLLYRASFSRFLYDAFVSC